MASTSSSDSVFGPNTGIVPGPTRMASATSTRLDDVTGGANRWGCRRRRRCARGCRRNRWLRRRAGPKRLLERVFLGEARRREEHQLGLGLAFPHLPRALQFDLQQRRRPGREALADRGDRGAVAVTCVLGPLQQAVLGDQPVELGIVDEVVVHSIDLAGALRPGGHRHRHPDLRVPAPDLRHHGALSYP